jgi:hypothetical protein
MVALPSFVARSGERGAELRRVEVVANAVAAHQRTIDVEAERGIEDDLIDRLAGPEEHLMPVGPDDVSSRPTCFAVTGTPFTISTKIV